jgi:hypothetical protein
MRLAFVSLETSHALVAIRRGIEDMSDSYLAFRHPAFYIG